MNWEHERPTPVATMESLRRTTLVVYILQAVGLLIPITMVVAVVVDYVKREDVAGTWLESHFRWQIRTFWFTLLWVVLGSLLTAVAIGHLILLAAGVWYIYRVVKGWLRLSDGREVEVPV